MTLSHGPEVKYDTENVYVTQTEFLCIQKFIQNKYDYCGARYNAIKIDRIDLE